MLHEQHAASISNTCKLKHIQYLKCVKLLSKLENKWWSSTWQKGTGWPIPFNRKPYHASPFNLMLLARLAYKFSSISLLWKQYKSHEEKKNRGLTYYTDWLDLLKTTRYIHTEFSKIEKFVHHILCYQPTQVGSISQFSLSYNQSRPIHTFWCLVSLESS
jgi:hypothetical protein